MPRVSRRHGGLRGADRGGAGGRGVLTQMWLWYLFVPQHGILGLTAAKDMKIPSIKVFDESFSKLLRTVQPLVDKKWTAYMAELEAARKTQEFRREPAEALAAIKVDAMLALAALLARGPKAVPTRWSQWWHEDVAPHLRHAF